MNIRVTWAQIAFVGLLAWMGHKGKVRVGISRL